MNTLKETLQATVLSATVAPYIEALELGANRLWEGGHKREAERLIEIAGWYRIARHPRPTPAVPEGEKEEDIPAPAFTIDDLGGNCPVQGEGRCLGGRRYYFRARGETLQIWITRAPLAGEPDYLNWNLPDEAVWYYEQGYGIFPDAGWIDRETAVSFIDLAVRKFRADILLAPHTAVAVANSREWIDEMRKKQEEEREKPESGTQARGGY